MDRYIRVSVVMDGAKAMCASRIRCLQALGRTTAAGGQT